MTPDEFGFTWEQTPPVAPALMSTRYQHLIEKGSLVRRQHPAWLIEYAYSRMGSYRVVSPTRPWRVWEAQTAHLFPPGATRWEDTHGADETLKHCACVAFSGGDAAGLSKLILPRYHFARFLDPDGAMGELIEQIARTGHQLREEGFWRAQGLLCALFDMMLCNATYIEHETWLISEGPHMKRPSLLVQDAEQYMLAHLAEPVSLQSMAHHLNVSISSLSHRFREATGQSPMARLRRLRITLAKSLLLQGQPLKDIASAAGFCDAFHLSKAFKIEEGEPPRRYLERLRGPK